MEDFTRGQVIERADILGLYCGTWSPGDGTTRYRFGVKTEESGHDDYFGPNSPLYTAWGIVAARAWLSGYAAGIVHVP